MLKYIGGKKQLYWAVKVKMTAQNRQCFMQTHTMNIKRFKPFTVINTFYFALLSVGRALFFLICWMFYILKENLVILCLLQKDADRAAVVAVTSRAVFELDEGDDVCRLGVAHPLLQVTLYLQTKPILTTNKKIFLIIMWFTHAIFRWQHRNGFACFMQNMRKNCFIHKMLPQTHYVVIFIVVQ